MYPDLVGKVVLVTGAGAGIGRAIAERFASEGSAVAVNDRDAGTADEVARAICTSGGSALSVPGDMTDDRSIEDVVRRVREAFGGIDVLVNNVGLFEFGELLGLPAEAWQRSIDLNVTSAYKVSNLVAPLMLDRGSGAIVNISSGAGKIGGTLAGAYSVAKWALIGFTKSLAAELAPRIRVNAVCPGIIQTRMDEAYVARATAALGVAPAAYVANRLERIPMGREGTAEDVAKAVAFLASDEAAYTTGEAMNVSGGMIMH